MDPIALVEDRVLHLNRLGMQSSLEPALDYVEHALHALNYHAVPPDHRLWAVTYNNLACLYKRTGNYAKAINLLQAGIATASSANASELASLHLNVCTIFSRLGNHCDALTHAHKALETLIKAEQETRAALTTALAYYNIGIESQYMGRTHEAVNTFRTGYEFAQRHIGKHPLTDKLYSLFLGKTEARATPVPAKLSPRPARSRPRASRLHRPSISKLPRPRKRVVFRSISCRRGNVVFRSASNDISRRKYDSDQKRNKY